MDGVSRVCMVHDGLSYFSLGICCGIFLRPGDSFLFILYQAMRFRRLNSDRFPLVQISFRQELSQTYRLCNRLRGESKQLIQRRAN